jgi:hypothetical protein
VAAYKEIDEVADPEWRASLFIDLTIVSHAEESYEQGRDYAREGETFVINLDSTIYHHDRYLFFIHYGRTCMYLGECKDAARLFSLALTDKLSLNREEEAGKISLLYFELFRAYAFDHNWELARTQKDLIRFDLLDLVDKRSWHYVMLYYLYNGCENRGRESLQVFEQYKSIGINEVYLATSLYFAAAAHFELQNRVMARKLMLEAIEAGLSPDYREYAEQLVKILDRK